MAAFTRWYLGKLSSHPMTTNLTSALVLMSAGDIFAQEIEVHNAEDSVPKPPPKLEIKDNTTKSKLSFRRYGTLSPDIRAVKEEQRKRAREAARDPDEFVIFDEWDVVLSSITSTIRDEVKVLDFFRTGTMAFYSVAFYTPYYIFVYRLFDRYLPMQVTPASVAARVSLSFIAAIPGNAVFFIYGSYVHHLTEWTGLVEEWRNDLEEEMGVKDVTLADIAAEIPFDFDMAWNAAHLKLTSEMPVTTVTSGIVWIPINVVNFSLVPPHLRPLVLMVCSAFWNAYMSLAQHRDASI